jgi:hypothetical protein
MQTVRYAGIVAAPTGIQASQCLTVTNGDVQSFWAAADQGPTHLLCYEDFAAWEELIPAWSLTPPRPVMHVTAKLDNCFRNDSDQFARMALENDHLFERSDATSIRGDLQHSDIDVEGTIETIDEDNREVKVRTLAGNIVRVRHPGCFGTFEVRRIH